MSNNIQVMSCHGKRRVGIVLVSHSVRLAEGAADTSAAKVERALGAAEADASVLVLPDLGSET